MYTSEDSNGESSQSPLLKLFNPMLAEPLGTPLLAHSTNGREAVEEAEEFTPQINSMASDTSPFSMFASPHSLLTSQRTPTPWQEPDTAASAHSEHMPPPVQQNVASMVHSEHVLPSLEEREGASAAHSEDGPPPLQEREIAPAAYPQYDPVAPLSANEYDDIRWDTKEDELPMHLRQRYHIEDPWKEGYTRIITIGDVHGDYSELIALLEDAGIITNVRSPTDWDWAATKVIVVSMGDLIDRGSQNMEVLDLFIEMEATAASHGNKVFLLRGKCFSRPIQSAPVAKSHITYPCRKS